MLCSFVPRLGLNGFMTHGIIVAITRGTRLGISDLFRAQGLVSLRTPIIVATVSVSGRATAWIISRGISETIFPLSSYWGEAGVVVFNDRHFSGGSHEFKNSVEDLRNRKFEDGHTWNNRISSVIVR